MSKADKLRERMQANPHGWRIEHLETLAKRHDVRIRRGDGSHVVFSHPDSHLVVTVPAHRPIKPPYIRQFLALIEDIEE